MTRRGGVGGTDLKLPNTGRIAVLQSIRPTFVNFSVCYHEPIGEDAHYPTSLICPSNGRRSTYTTLGRMFGTLRLNAATYEDVEHDKRAIYQALFIVIMVSAATVGGELLSGQDTALWWSILRGVIRGVASWAAWALCTWALGEILFDVVETDADWGQLARTTGFA